MKRVLLALAILAAGTLVFSELRQSAAQLRTDAASARNAWLAQKQLVTQTRVQCTELTARVNELKQSLLNQPRALADELAVLIATNGAIHLSAEAREKLLAELGFDWNTSADYLVVSKDSLRDVGLNAVRDSHLTDTVCNVLALTPAERGAVDGVMDRVAADYKTWATAHVQREEPQGEVVAKYTLKYDAEFSRSLSNAFTSAVAGALPGERAEWLLGYARSWMVDLGMDTFGVPPSPTTLTVKRATDGLAFELRQNGGTMYTMVSPGQPFPNAFRAVFPGGWTELAQREGFDLPKEFANQPARP